MWIIKNSSQILYVKIHEFKIKATISDSGFEKESDIQLDCLKIALELNSQTYLISPFVINPDVLTIRSALL